MQTLIKLSARKFFIDSLLDFIWKNAGKNTKIIFNEGFANEHSLRIAFKGVENDKEVVYITRTEKDGRKQEFNATGMNLFEYLDDVFIVHGIERVIIEVE